MTNPHVSQKPGSIRNPVPYEKRQAMASLPLSWMDFKVYSIFSM
jgi:hypothetical protein